MFQATFFLEMLQLLLSFFLLNIVLFFRTVLIAVRVTYFVFDVISRDL